MVASPFASPSTTQAADNPTVGVATSKDLGQILVDKDGMSLYIFTHDPVNDSACYDKCEVAWPPLLVDSADKLTTADGIPGKFSTITRKDGKIQVAYNGQPLYYWFKDKAAGDTLGNRVGRVWWVVRPATVSFQKLPKVGTVLVGPTGMTLYMYTKDTADTSTCYDKCAEKWPPLLVNSEKDLMPGLNLPGKFATTTRKDGKIQVTYNGMPLYYWADDKAIGDATGENVGKVWFTVVPETAVVAKSKDLGDILTTADGMTLYTFAKDTKDTSACTGDCLKAWPAYTVLPEDRVAAGTGIKGKFGTITRDDKSIQVTYNGMPLYFYAKDTKPGDATGNKVGNVWNVVTP